MLKREGTFFRSIICSFVQNQAKLDEKSISSKKVILPGMLVLVDELIFHI